MSCLIFVIAVEILAARIRNEKDIDGFKINGNSSKIAQLADDTTLFLKRKDIKRIQPFHRKLVLSILHKIDYFLSWTITHSNLLIILEHELKQLEDELRHQLTQYQHDKNCIEKNLKHIRLQQQTTNGTNRIQEL